METFHLRFFQAEVQLAVNAKRGWLQCHVSHCPCPPSGRNGEKETEIEGE